MLNTVVLIGYVSRPPRKFGKVFFFPLAVYRDPDHSDGQEPAVEQRDMPDFPPVIVVIEGKGLPSFIRHKAPVRVEGWVRTRNRTEPLYKRVRKDLIKAGMDPQKAIAIANLIPRDLESRTVEVEIVAERIWPEWREPPKLELERMETEAEEGE